MTEDLVRTGVRSILMANLQRDYERARTELRKLNDAMIRKNRRIVWLEREREELSQFVDKVEAERQELDVRNDTVFALLLEIDELTSGYPTALADWAAVNSKLIRMRAVLTGQAEVKEDGKGSEEDCSRAEGTP